jgi:hypothetical protein
MRDIQIKRLLKRLNSPFFRQIPQVASTTWSEHTRSMDRVDCTRISDALARKLPSSGTMGRLLEQMPQVASAQKTK